MAQAGKYSVEIVVKSDDKVLTNLKYPDQSYADCVGTQAAILSGLLKAGAAYAAAKGDPLPTGVGQLFENFEAAMASLGKMPQKP